MSRWSALRSERSFARSFLSFRMSFLSFWMSCCWGVGSWLWAYAPPASKPAKAIASTPRRTTCSEFIVFSPIRLFLESPPHLQNQTPGALESCATSHARLERGSKKRNYFVFNDLWTASSTPFTKAPDSSEENFFARSTASFSTTLGGVSVPFISWTASRKMARSMAARRSNRQLSACLTIIASSAVTSFTVPSKSLFANERVLSAALALFQNFASSLEKSCWLMSHWNSICIANSRDFVRRDTLLAPRLSSVCQVRMRGAKLSRQLCHFDGGEARFESLVAAF